MENMKLRLMKFEAKSLYWEWLTRSLLFVTWLLIDIYIL